MVWTAEQKRQDRLQEAIGKKFAGGCQAYATEERKADTIARLAGTTRATPPSHMKVSEGFGTLPMERQDGRTAEPAPPPFVANLWHRRAHARACT